MAIEGVQKAGCWRRLTATGELMRVLELNCRAMELLANRFLELVREDCGRARVMMQRNRSKEAKLQSAQPGASC
jgi:hypothetical protein